MPFAAAGAAAQAGCAPSPVRPGFAPAAPIGPFDPWEPQHAPLYSARGVCASAASRRATEKWTTGGARRRPARR
jgi:hypothetical protein